MTIAIVGMLSLLAGFLLGLEFPLPLVTEPIALPAGFVEGRFGVRAIDADGRELVWPPANLTNRQVVTLVRPAGP